MICQKNSDDLDWNREPWQRTRSLPFELESETQDTGRGWRGPLSLGGG